jgi:peroxiredoxin
MALKKGDKAPAFTLYDTEKKSRSLGEFLGRKTVLAFYPGAFTGVCTKEMCTFRDSLSTLGSLNAQVVGISIDSPFANRAFAEQNKLTYPLLSDFSLEVSRSYGGLQENFSGLKSYTVSKRAVFVLDSGGVVQYAWITDNPGVEPPYSEIEKALSSFRQCKGIQLLCPDSLWARKPPIFLSLMARVEPFQ